MLSYRHGFHAGNHADLLKHLVLTRVLAYLTQKPKPFCCIDTHSGAGLYDLGGGQAMKNREFDTGIGRLRGHQDIPALLGDYLAVVADCNSGGEQRFYPGSPWFERHWLREADRLVLCELHPTEFNLLRENFGGNRRIKLLKEDGLKALKALLPPKERRGLVLIDPSYEIKDDYDAVVDALKQAHGRFAGGTYALWYPVVARQRVVRLEQRLCATGIRNIEQYELSIVPDGMDLGMTGSGMLVINPPWTLKAEMEATLPWLAGLLGQADKGWYRIETLVPE